MSDKIKTGTKGENLAADFLKMKGFEILVRNFRHKKSEIDLIVKKENWVIFVEVKTRSYATFGEPEDFVSYQQMRKLFEAAEEYIFSTNWHGHVRFDVISIKMGAPPEIVHFEDAIN